MQSIKFRPPEASFHFDDENRLKRFKRHKSSDNLVKPYNERRLWSSDDLLAADQKETNEELNQLTVMTLPVEFMRRPSLASVRLRKDPLFQGNRARRHPRVIFKNGDRNVSFKKIPEKSMLYIRDFVTTLVDEQWRFLLMIFGLSFFLSWLIFAMIWYVIALSHGDLEFDPKTARRLGEGSQPCIVNAKSLLGFFLFSIETQMTIGFGQRFPTEECPEAVFLVCLQIVVGKVIEGTMVGIVYAKMVRPPKRSVDLKFSKNAIVGLRDGKLCLMFRVCDFRQTHVIATKVQAFYFDQVHLRKGKTIKYLKCNLKLQNDGSMFLIWPTTVVHEIDSQSPLYNFSAKDLLDKKFEICVSLSGCSRSNGQLTESRSSYLAREILWGHRFQNMVKYDYRREAYLAGYEKFDMVIPVDTPLCSARRLDRIRWEYDMASKVSCNTDSPSYYVAEEQ